jgi:D-3-phosphoglycerate dehydrogenase
LKPRIFVSVYPFSREDETAKRALESTGWDITYNTLGRKMTTDEVTELALTADGIVAGTENLTRLIERSDTLKMISRVGIGLDSVPLKLCREKKIAVSYTPDAVTPAVVEMILGVMISISRKLFKADQEIREGKWPRHYGKRIGKSVIGIIGFGRVGSQVARYLIPFQPSEVLVNDIKDVSGLLNELSEVGLRIRATTKDEIYALSDIISIHTPLTNKTYHMISANEINIMKQDAFLINAARGGIINEEDLYQAIKKERIAGAALDVFEKEPYHGKLSELKNIILTQHMGSCSYDCRNDMELQAVEEIIRFFRAEPLIRQVPDEELEYQAE